MSKKRALEVPKDLSDLSREELEGLTKALLLSAKRATPIARFPATIELAQLKAIIDGTTSHLGEFKLPESLRFHTADEIGPDDAFSQDQIAEVDIIIVAPCVEVTLRHEFIPPKDPSDPAYSISMYDQVTPSGDLNQVVRDGESYPKL